MTARRRFAAGAIVAGAATAVVSSVLALPAQAATVTATTKARVYTGPSVSTMFGPVQVRIRVKAGVVTRVTAIAFPQGDRRSASINAYAIPVLQKQAVTAQSASLDGVSGASYTSRAFAASLQAALTKAGL